MSRDVFNAILDKMDSSVDRFALTKVDQKMHEKTKNWSDVNSILINGRNVLIGKENTKYIVNMEKKADISILSSVLSLCPSIRRFYIEEQLTAKTIEWINENNKKINKLYISNENFDTRYSVDLSPLVLSSCQALYILEKQNNQITTKCRVPNNLLKNFFPASLRRVCLTGVTVDGPLLRHLAGNLPALASLDLLGTVANTENTKEFIEILENNTALEELSLAPSMFSFSTKSNNKDLGFTFRNLHVAKLSIYMLVFDDQWFSMQLKDWFSKELKTLVLYGNCSEVNLQDNSVGFKLLVGPMNPISASKTVPGGSSFLVSHLVRQPPYLISSQNRPITASSWKCDLEGLIREQEAAIAAVEHARRARLQEGILRRPRPAGAPRIVELAVPAVPAAAPVGPVANADAGLASTSTVPTASSRSYVTTPFPTNSSVSNESVNRTNFNVTSMELVSSINPTSPLIRPATAQEVAAAGADNTPPPTVTQPAEATRQQPALDGQNVVAIEPIATSTPMMTSQRENNTNARATAPLEASVIGLNERIAPEVGGARMRNDPNGPIGEENVVTAGGMEEAFEDLLLATMATMLADIEAEQNEEAFHQYDVNNMDFFVTLDEEFDGEPDDASPIVSPIEEWGLAADYPEGVSPNNIPYQILGGINPDAATPPRAENNLTAETPLRTAIETPSAPTVTRPVLNSNENARNDSSNVPSTSQ